MHVNEKPRYRIIFSTGNYRYNQRRAICWFIRMNNPKTYKGYLNRTYIAACLWEDGSIQIYEI